MSAGITLVVNPVAGAGHPLDRWPGVERALAARGEVTRVEPTGEQALAAVVREAADQGRIVVVAGGDGTVNRVVNALGGRDVPIGIVPVGSGNDLARALNLPSDPIRAAHRIASSTATRVDLVAVNGQRFCTVGGLGLVADVTMRVGRWSLPGRPSRPFVRRLGSQAYLLAAAARIASPASRPSVVRATGEGPEGFWRWEGECHAALVANQPTLGAGLALPVASSAADGCCEVCFVPRRARLSLALRLAALRNGRPQPEDVLTVRRSAHATLEVDTVVAFAADGDVLCADRRFDVTVLPKALQVLA